MNKWMNIILNILLKEAWSLIFNTSYRSKTYAGWMLRNNECLINNFINHCSDMIFALLVFSQKKLNYIAVVVSRKNLPTVGLGWDWGLVVVVYGVYLVLRDAPLPLPYRDLPTGHNAQTHGG